MEVIMLDLKGLKCPQPSMKVAAALVKLKAGDVIEATADCDTFEDDLKSVCKRWNALILSVKQSGAAKTIQVKRQ